MQHISTTRNNLYVSGSGKAAGQNNDGSQIMQDALGPPGERGSRTDPGENGSSGKVALVGPMGKRDAPGKNIS